jgi:predicted nucleotidyltransferase
MVRERIIKQIKKDFQFIKNNPKILGLLLYGSHLRDDTIDPRDIDICIVAPNQNLYEMYQYIMSNLKSHIGDYDIRFFEELPLHIKGPIMEEGLVIYSPDEPALYEYFFFSARKEWEDHKLQMKYLSEKE